MIGCFENCLVACLEMWLWRTICEVARVEGSYSREWNWYEWKHQYQIQITWNSPLEYFGEPHQGLWWSLVLIQWLKHAVLDRHPHFVCSPLRSALSNTDLWDMTFIIEGWLLSILKRSRITIGIELWTIVNRSLCCLVDTTLLQAWKFLIE